MSHEPLTSGGVELTEELIEKLADEAEEGYDLDQIRKGRREPSRTPRQIARQFLDAAVEQGVVDRYILRNSAGGGTVFWTAYGKSFPKNVLELIAALESQGFKAQ